MNGFVFSPDGIRNAEILTELYEITKHRGIVPCRKELLQKEGSDVNGNIWRMFRFYYQFNLCFS